MKAEIETQTTNREQIETTSREQMYGYQGGKGWGGRNWETGIDTYTLLILCIKWITDGNMLCSTGNSPSTLW